MITTASASSRPSRRHFGSEELGLLALAALLALVLLTAATGQLTAVLAGHGWPSWAGTGTAVAAPIVGVFADPADPMATWPDQHGHPPAGWLFWLVFALLVTVAATMVAVPTRLYLRRRTQPGFARRADVAARLGATALLGQAPRLRPQLVTTTPRPTPEQLGAHRGTDVHSGTTCYASVRQSSYVVGPSESGKTSCVVIPEALDHDGPLLAPSSRADVMAATWQARADRGEVMLFDPLHSAPGLPLLRWDPVTACVDPVVALRRAQALISTVDMTTVSNGDAWKNRGEAVLRNLLHAAALGGHTIETVLRWTANPTSQQPAALLRESSRTPTNWAEEQQRTAQLPDKQRSGVYMPVEGAMAMFAHPAVLHTSTPRAAEAFHPATFTDPTSGGGHRTLYLLSQRAEAVAVAGLLAALLDEIIVHAREKAQRQPNNRLDPPLRLLADEAPNTTTLRSLPDLISDGGGRGIPTTMVVQDRAQAVARWGRDDAASMWGAATMRLVLPGVAGMDELREIASYAGDYDEHTDTTTRGGGSGRTVQTSWRTLPALQPADVRAIPPQHALLIAAGGLRPVLTRLTPYYRRHDAARSAESERRFYTALTDGRSVL